MSIQNKKPGTRNALAADVSVCNASDAEVVEVEVPGCDEVKFSTLEKEGEVPVETEVWNVLLSLGVAPPAASRFISLKTSAMLSPPLSPGTAVSATGFPLTYTTPLAVPEGAIEYVVPATTTPAWPTGIMWSPITYGGTEVIYTLSSESVIFAVASNSTNAGAVVKCAASTDPVSVAAATSCSSEDIKTSGLVGFWPEGLDGGSGRGRTAFGLPRV